MGLDLYTVLIQGLEMYAYHGVSDAEQAVGHRYSFDISLRVRGAAVETDRIEDSVSYADVAAITTEVCLSRQFRTLEKLAATIADSLMALPGVEGLEIRATKPLPPMPHMVREAGVILSRGTR